MWISEKLAFGDTPRLECCGATHPNDGGCGDCAIKPNACFSNVFFLWNYLSACQIMIGTYFQWWTEGAIRSGWGIHIPYSMGSQGAKNSVSQLDDRYIGDSHI